MRKCSHLTVKVRNGMWGASGRPGGSRGSWCQALPACPPCARGLWVSLPLVVLILPREATTPTLWPFLLAKLQPGGQPDPRDSQLWAETSLLLPRYVSALKQHTMFWGLAKAES